MKKITLVFASALFAVIFASCAQDTENTNTENEIKTINTETIKTECTIEVEPDSDGNIQIELSDGEWEGYYVKTSSNIANVEWPIFENQTHKYHSLFATESGKVTNCSLIESSFVGTDKNIDKILEIAKKMGMSLEDYKKNGNELSSFKKHDLSNTSSELLLEEFEDDFSLEFGSTYEVEYEESSSKSNTKVLKNSDNKKFYVIKNMVWKDINSYDSTSQTIIVYIKK